MRRSEASETIKTPKTHVVGAVDQTGGSDAARSANKMLENWETTFGTGAIDSLSDRRSPIALDSPFIQQTKDKIRELVAEIAHFAQKPVQPAEFFQFSFPRILTAMGADGIAIWAWRENIGWNLVQARGLATDLTRSSGATAGSDDSDSNSTTLFDDLDQIEMQLTEASEPSAESVVKANAIRPSVPHERLLTEARSERQPVLIPPRDATIDTQRAPNPTSQTVMLVPIAVPMNDGELWLEIFQHPSGGPASQRGYLRFAAQMADMLAEFLKTFRMNLLEHDQEFLLNAQRLIDRSLPSQNNNQPMSTLLACVRDNVHASHVFWLRRKAEQRPWRIQGIAGLEKIDRRVSGINIIEQFANSVSHQTFRNGEYLFSIEDSSPLRSESKSDLVATEEQRRFSDAFGIKHGLWFDPYAVLPERPLRTQTLIEELLPDLGDDSHDSTSNRSVNSSNDALIIVWSEDQPPPAGCLTQSALLFRLGRNIVEPKGTQGSALGTLVKTSVRNLATKWGLFLVFVSMLAGVMAIPVPLMIESSAVMVPVDIEELYAPADGVVERVLVEHGQIVTPGTPLIQMQSNSLGAELEKTKATIIQHDQRAAELDNRLLRDRNLTPVDRDALETERETIRIALEYEKKALELIQVQWEQLTIRAKSNAIVETWQVAESLNGRPVRMGQWLFSLRSPTTKWELEAKIPERNLDELTQSQSNPNADAFARLIAAPKTKWKITTKSFETWRSAQQQSTDLLPMYLVRFQVNDELPHDLALAGATARISVSSGKAPLIWALSKDFVETFLMRARMWFP
jgi:multidrug efflux pump subunit AcrA (membrane-fusion protein)